MGWGRGGRRAWRPRLSEKQFSVWEFLGPKQLRPGLPDAEPEVRGGDGKRRTNPENIWSQKGAVQRLGAISTERHLGTGSESQNNARGFPHHSVLLLNLVFSRRKIAFQCWVVRMRATSLQSRLTRSSIKSQKAEKWLRYIRRAWVRAHSLSVRLFATSWVVAGQAPLSMGFSRQEYWSGLVFSPPGDLPDPGIKPTSLTSPALAGRFFSTSTTSEALCWFLPYSSVNQP